MGNDKEGRGKILILENKQVLSKLTSILLESFGFDVKLASSGMEAFEMFESAYSSESPYDIVMVDLSISEGKGGIITAKQILELCPEAEVHISSDKFASGDNISCHKHYFSDLLESSLKNEKLKNTIIIAIDGSKINEQILS